jgi:predicted ATPase
VVALDAGGTQGRFHLTLQKFIQVFTRPAHPLVVFLDDTQWADPESIHLLKLVASSEATESLLLIEAFRDNEVTDAHPVMIAARELGQRHQVTRLDIAPLATAEIAALVADTLHREVADVEPLARLVCRKTDGNPFFVRQLLLALHAAGHIQFDAAERRFTFDAASIERAPISENVADLLADSLRKLPPSTQRVLALAAAMGNRFELELLAPIAGLAPAALHAELTAAIEQELVVPLSDLEYVASPAGSGLIARRLRFQHDRIQRAAYVLMSPENQQRTHLRIGELLLTDATPAQLGDRIFEIVSQLNRAVALIDAPDQIARLARLNVAAARRARGSAAYASAVDCLRIAIDRLDWTTAYEERFEAQLMLAECLYLGYHAAAGLDARRRAQPAARRSGRAPDARSGGRGVLAGVEPADRPGDRADPASSPSPRRPARRPRCSTSPRSPRRPARSPASSSSTACSSACSTSSSRTPAPRAARWSARPRAAW